MSRFSDWDGEEDFPNQAEFWWKRAQLALEGRRGRKALAALREALLALPEPRLIESALCKPIVEDGAVVGGEVCVIGAYLWHQKVKAGMDPVAAFASLPDVRGDDEDDYCGQAGVETAKAGRAAGLTYTLAYELAFQNDEDYSGYTPEERHAHFLEWIDAQLAKPPLRRPEPKSKRERPARPAFAELPW